MKEKYNITELSSYMSLSYTLQLQNLPLPCSPHIKLSFFRQGEELVISISKHQGVDLFDLAGSSLLSQANGCAFDSPNCCHRPFHVVVCVHAHILHVTYDSHCITCYGLMWSNIFFHLTLCPCHPCSSVVSKIKIITDHRVESLTKHIPPG